MARRRRDESLATRGRILEAATRSFARRGISNTTLADVAASASVTRGAIYHHFGSREALLDAVIERVPWPPLAVERPPASRAVERPLEALRHAAARAIVRILSRPADRGVAEILLFQSPAGAACALRQDQARRKCVARIAAWLALAVRSGQLPAGFDVLQASRRMHANLVGLVAQQLATSRETERLRDGTQPGSGSRASQPLPGMPATGRSLADDRNRHQASLRARPTAASILRTYTDGKTAA